MQPKLLAAVAAFAATVPAANWMIEHVGFQPDPSGPHLIPVGFGFSAPSGVLMVGAGLVLRDIVHELGGWRAAFIAILIGAGLSWLVAAPSLVIASVAAFLLAETADLLVYAPLRRRQLGLAVLASGAVGAAVDSAVFLWLAFGSLAFIEGQILGKLWMSLAALPVLYAIRRRVEPTHG
ncbi:MAG: beta-carotene 15,15'-monooxygenase [Pelagibacterium sp. SCN 64-44]|nr:MAG: beta-carotene 15,15'-monooxygenase [Pelagibacterium sp. SCN 64-44]